MKKITIVFVIFFLVLFGIIVAKVYALEEFNKEGFECHLISRINKKTVNLCLQKVEMVAGVDMIMGQHKLFTEDVYIRLTEDDLANKERLVHELFHFVTTKYISQYNNQELLSSKVQEDMAYDMQKIYAEGSQLVDTFLMNR